MISKLTNKEIKPFMTFGKMPIANGFLNKEDFEKEFFFEMKVGFCEDLSLFQILEHPKPEMMFNEKYPFYTSSSNFMINHFKLYADWIKKNYLKNSKKLIEIGSNDGTFLKNFENLDIETIGFEPSKNVSDAAKNQGINSICQFFNTILRWINYIYCSLKNFFTCLSLGKIGTGPFLREIGGNGIALTKLALTFIILLNSEIVIVEIKLIIV